MFLPGQAPNAKLTKVVSAVNKGMPTNDYRSPVGGLPTPTTIWEGEADAKVDIDIVESTASGQLDYFQRRSVLFPYVGQIESGAQLTLEYEGVSETWTVNEVQHTVNNVRSLTRCVLDAK